MDFRDVTWLFQTPELRVGKSPTHYIAHWPTLGCLVSTLVDNHITLEPGVAPEMRAKLEHGAMRGMLRHLRGEHSLHASAVSTKEGAILFLGDSGAGKSTLAYQLVTSGWRSARLLSDDVAMLEGNHVLPSETAVWLVADVGKQARAVDCASTGGAIRALVDLTFGDLGVRRLRGVSAFNVVFRALVRFVLDEPAFVEKDVQRVVTLVQHAPVWRLARPKGLHAMDVLPLLEQVVT